MSAPRVARASGRASPGLAAAHRLRTLLGPDAAITLLEQRDRIGGVLRTVDLAGRPLRRRRRGVPRAAARGAGAAGRARAGRTARAPDGGGRVDPRGGPHGGAARRHGAGRADERGPAGRAALARRARGGGGRARPPAGLVAGRRRGARPVAAGPLRRRADRPARRPAARRRLRRAGRRPRPAAHDARARRGARRGRALPHRGGRRRHAPAAVPQRRVTARCRPGNETRRHENGDSPSRKRGSPAHLGEMRDSPVFGGLRGGYRVLLDALADAARADLRLGTTVRAIEPSAAGWLLVLGPTTAPEALEVDAVVLAVPAPAVARLLADRSPRPRRTRRRASSWRRRWSSRWRTGSEDVAAARHVGRAGGRGRAPPVKGVTYSSTKWAAPRRATASSGCAPRSAGTARPPPCRPTTPR